jgi:hypothetical protein
MDKEKLKTKEQLKELMKTFYEIQKKKHITDYEREISDFVKLNFNEIMNQINEYRHFWTWDEKEQGQ